MDRNQELHIEKDFWDDFIVEAFEHIDAIESNAMDLEKNPENMDIIHTMFRAFHTIKGLSGFVEHTIVQELAHKTETMMDLCRKGELKVSTQIVDAILKSSDYVKQLCDDVDAYKDQDLMDNIEKLLIVLEEISNTELFDVGGQSQVVENAFESQSEFVNNQEFENVHSEEMQEEMSFESAPENNEHTQEFCENNNEEEFVPAQPEGLEAFAMEITNIEESIEHNSEPESEVQDFNTNENPENAFVLESNEPSQEPVEDVPVFNSEVQEQSIFVMDAATVQEEVKENKPVTEEDSVLKSFRASVLDKLKGTSSAVEDVKESGPKHSSANEEYMKVANYKIDHLVDMMGELIINQALIDQYVSQNYNDDRQLVTNMSGFLRITRELQNLSMSLRMVGLKPTFQKLTRVARDTIQELHKDVEFVTSGENTEIDRAVAEKLLDPLVHMIKNAISHGIEEDPADRVRVGKTPRARVELNAYSKRGKIFIEVKDDGKGINTEIVYKKALEKGIVDPNRTYSDAEIKEFIMLPGFSTAKVVDNISGRGVGMDVVRTQILKLGGKVEIQSILNEGSTFTLEVPVNHAIMNGTIIEMNDQYFVVPTVNVKEFLQPTESQWIFTKEQRTMIRVRDNIIPIVPLGTFFKGIEEPKHVPLVMVLELDQELRAVPIVNVVNRQEVVVKPTGSEFSNLKYISGMSILGTGKVSLILDIDYLFKKEVKE